MKHYEVVCAIIVNNKNEIFVCQRGPERQLDGKWEFPGGKVEANETHEQTIIREIKEELKSTIEPIKYIGKSYYEYTSLALPFSITLYGYLCKLIDGNLSLTEHVDSKWVNKENLKLVDFCEADKPFIEMLLKC